MIDPNLITTKSVSELPVDAISLSSKIPHELTGILKQGTIQELVDLLAPLVGKMQFEIVELDVTQQYITDNFDITGLGINLCAGFAICNGNNGTIDRDGRSSIAYGGEYSFVGVPIGSKDAIVVSHTHSFPNTLTGKGTGGAGDFASNASNISYSDNTTTLTEGESGINKNYHPCIVTLTIMKL